MELAGIKFGKYITTHPKCSHVLILKNYMHINKTHWKEQIHVEVSY